DFRHFLDHQSLFGSVGPSISWPIFQGGRILSNIELQKAITEELLATYGQTILTAFRDVQDGLVNYQNEMIRHRSLVDAVKYSRRALEESNDYYKIGLGQFLNVLISQRSLYDSQDALVQ